MSDVMGTQNIKHMILITLKIGILFINVYDEGLIKIKIKLSFLKNVFLSNNPMYVDNYATKIIQPSVDV